MTQTTRTSAAPPMAAPPYPNFERLSDAECRLLYEMLKSVGASPDNDTVMARLVEHMAQRERTAASRRRRAARIRRGEV